MFCKICSGVTCALYLIALVVAVVIDNGSSSLDHPVLEYAATKQRRESISSSSSSSNRNSNRHILSLGHKRATSPTTGLAEFERGGNHFDPEKDGFFDDFGFEKGQYVFGQKENLDFTDIRNNIPGEPGIDYAAYLNVPRTRFSCIGRTQGYYADEETGCQVFHVCGGGEGVDKDRIASFLCPVGSLFSQHLLTCDWWSKVTCGISISNTQDYVGRNEKVIDWIKMNFVGGTDLVMMNRADQEPKKPTFRGRQQINAMEINGKQMSSPKKIEHSHFAGAAFANEDERVSQSIQPGSLTANTTVKVDNRLVENTRNSRGENKSEITSTPNLNEIENDAKVTAGRAVDIDGQESIGLINAHSRRMNSAKLVAIAPASTNLEFLEPSFTEKTNIDQPQHVTWRKLNETRNHTAATVADEMKYLSESDTLKVDNVALNITEVSENSGSNDAVSAAGINNQSPRDNTSAVEYPHEDEDVSIHIASATQDKNGFLVTHGDSYSSVNSRHQTAPPAAVNVKRYKTQNVHNISGFKINRPLVIAVAAAAADAEKFQSNLNPNTIYQQQQPAMQTQLARPPQTHRQGKGVEKMESNLENYSIEQNHDRTNLTDISWQGNRGQAGIQKYSTNNAVKRRKHLEQQEFKQDQLLYGRRRHLHDMKFTVNYHTHYYPEIYPRSAAAAAAAADHVDIGNNHEYKTDHHKKTNYAVPHDESQSSITCYGHCDDAVSEVKQKQASHDLEFGSRIHAAAAAVVGKLDNDNYHYQQYSAIVNNPEISRNAYKINSELQKESRGLAVVGHVQTVAVAATPAKDNLPRPFTAAKNDVNHLHAMDSHISKNDANSFSASDDLHDSFEHAAVKAAATAADDEGIIIAGADDEKMPIDDSYKGEYIQRASAKEEEEEEEELQNKRKAIEQTEFIASLGFDL